jgi:glyceraldehyde-3-phosphate dehydrogenase (NADP+)
VAQDYLVGGVAGRSGSIDVVLNPYSGEPVDEVQLADARAVELALQRSEVGARAMRALPPWAIAGILDRAADLVHAAAEEFASLIMAEAGKPLYDARGEVSRSILNLRAAAEESKRVAGHEVPLEVDRAVSAYQGRRGESDGGRQRLAVARRVPIGTVLAVTPFNFPLNLVLHKVAPALAARNAVILKPAPQTPLTSLLLGRVLLEAGLPPEALSVLPCRNDAAELLVRDDRVAMLTFTGSAQVGWYLKSCAGKKRVTLELGGNGGVLIDQGCDELAYAAQRACRGGFVFAGQYCIGVQRILVHRSRHDEFLDLLLAETDRLTVGDPADESTHVGPVIDAGSADRIQSWVDESRAAGAGMLRGGHRMGNVLDPTVLTGTAFGMKVEDEEVFGPVVTVNPVDSWAEGLARLNGSKYGLQLGVFTNDISKALSAADALDAGTVVVNDAPIYRIDTMPFGGVKDSGTGREGTKYAMESMTDTKLIILSASTTGASPKEHQQ